MEGKLFRRIDGVYRSTVTLIADTWKYHPFRLPVLLLALLIAVTSSSSFVLQPNDIYTTSDAYVEYAFRSANTADDDYLRSYIRIATTPGADANLFEQRAARHC